jgi:hypothetical protein
MVFSPHSTFRPVSKLIASERARERGRVTTRSECVCIATVVSQPQKPKYL